MKNSKASYFLLYHYFFHSSPVYRNESEQLYSILVVLVGHGLVYLAYCILTVPFSFILILLNRYNSLNLLTICIAFYNCYPFFILLEWSHTGEISKEWKCIPIHGLFFMALFLIYVIGCF
jgi:hypothetical protein